MTIAQIVCYLITFRNIEVCQLLTLATTLSVKILMLATWNLLNLTKYEIYFTLYPNHISRSLQVIIFHEQKNSVQAFGFQIFLFSLLLRS